MVHRIAAILALIAFAMCLLIGVQAGNTFVTTVERALAAMAGTYVIGLVLALMGRRMIDENLRTEREKLKNAK